MTKIILNFEVLSYFLVYKMNCESEKMDKKLLC
jgi:hypothetical protein